MKKSKKNKGITLITLVVTVIVLLILARNNCSSPNRRKWIIKNHNKCQRKNRNIK